MYVRVTAFELRELGSTVKRRTFPSFRQIKFKFRRPIQANHSLPVRQEIAFNVTSNSSY